MKGQSAIEYLMTYGWMLLVVALVGGAVFSLVQGQGIESVSGFSGTEVSINDFGMNSDDELALSMRNTAADRVRIKAVELEDPETGATTRVLSEKQIQVGDTKTVKVDGFERTSSSNKQNLKIIYGSGGIDDQVVEGTITGKLKAKNHVYLQNAVYNRSTDTLNITARNTGKTEATVDYGVNSDSNSFTGNLGTLPSGETTSFTVNTDETFPLQNVSLNVDGQYFSNSQKRLKCTPTKGLVGYWPFTRDHVNGGEAEDLSGNVNHGEMDGGLSNDDLTDGKRSEALKFDGTNDIVNSDLSIDQTSDTEGVTMAAWVYPREGTDARRHVISSDDGGHDWSLNLDGDGTWNAFVGSKSWSSAHSVDWDEWQHVAVVFTQEDVVLYKNGEPSSRGSSPNYDTNDNPIAIGDNPGSWDEYFAGKINEPHIYKGPLSQSEIQRLYQVRSEDWAIQACELTN